MEHAENNSIIYIKTVLGVPALNLEALLSNMGPVLNLDAILNNIRPSTDP